jgi:hypothetical protein
MNKKKIYRMPLARVFPAKHPRAGRPTEFDSKIRCSIYQPSIKGYYHKIHTIRPDEKGLWKRRIEEVQQGNAVLALYQWNGKPCRSAQNNLFVFGASAAKGFIDELTTTERYRNAFPVIDSGIGTQELELLTILDKGSCYCANNFNVISRDILARNNGLSLDDFLAWFKNYDARNRMTIIHFTNFRY